MAFDDTRKPRSSGGAGRSSFGGGRSGGFGGRDGGRDGGERKPYAPRSGGGSFGGRDSGERKPYAPREGGERRPYTPRDGAPSGERRPYTPREGGSSFGGGRDGGERRPYSPRPPREGGFGGGRDGGERRPYTPREGGERRPYTPRVGGSSYGNRDGGERRPYTPRDGGERRPYTPREGGSSYGSRDGGFDRAPRAPREGLTPTSQGQYFDGKPMAEGFIFGTHAVIAVLRANRRKVRELWITHEPVGELAELLASMPEITPIMKAKPELDSKFDGMAHQGIAAQVGNLPATELGEILAANPQIILAVDQVTDPHNLGAILRSCAAFNVAAVLIPEHRTANVNPVVAKVAAGALETVPVVSIGNLAQTLKMLSDRGYAVLGLAGEEECVNLNEVEAQGPICVVVGSEGEGLRRLTRENCTQLVKIPMSSAIESLNVSVATGVALFTLTSKLAK